MGFRSPSLAKIADQPFPTADLQGPDLASFVLPDDAVDALIVHQRLVHVKSAPQKFAYRNELLPFAERRRGFAATLVIPRSSHHKS